MTKVALVCLLLFITNEAVTTNEEHLVCRKTQGSEGQSTQGRPGKRGPKGEKGVTGPVGPPGVVNYNILDSKIDRKIEQAISKLSAKVADLEVNLRVCPYPGRKVIRGQNCFWAYITHGLLRYDEAVKSCREMGATPANVYSEKHFNDLVEYLRSLTGEFVYVWLGMQYNPRANPQLTNYDGTRAQYVKWRPGHPTSHSGYNAVVLDAFTLSDRRSPGMLNQPPTWGKLGVLCEKK